MKKMFKYQLVSIIILGLLTLTGCEKDRGDKGLPADGDGNRYDTVKIGTQTWLKENLKTTKYRNGDPIYLVTDNEKWTTWQSGAYCWYDNGLKNKDVYGALYNWKAASSGMLCPEGWHVPTQDDWTTLIDHLGGIFYANKLKETGTIHWMEQTAGTTNETGFTALPGGYRYLDGTFKEIKQKGYWWWADIRRHTIITSYSDWIQDGAITGIGCSVRCLKDK